MTVQNPAIFLQAGSHPAEDVRRMLGAIAGDTTGIVADGELQVTQAGTPSMSVVVAGGRALIAGTEATYQGSYFVENRGSTSLAVAASSPTNPRFDLVVARVKDTSYSGAASAWSLEVVTGTAAPSPAEPAVPANSLVLARITVGAAVSSITNADITDRRTSASVRSAPRGVLGYKETTASQGGITSETDLTGLAVTVTVPAGRRLRITAYAHPQSTAAGDTGTLRIKEGATNLEESTMPLPSPATRNYTNRAEAVVTPSAGSHTYKVSLQRLDGSGTVSNTASGTQKSFILVEDIGSA